MKIFTKKSILKAAKQSNKDQRETVRRAEDFSNYIEDYWDFLCSELEILEDRTKQEMIKEYGRRVLKYNKENENEDL